MRDTGFTYTGLHLQGTPLKAIMTAWHNSDSPALQHIAECAPTQNDARVAMTSGTRVNGGDLNRLSF